MIELRHDMLLTIVSAVAAGGLIISISRRFNLPSIVLLLVSGVVCGPEVLGIAKPESINAFLPVFVAFAVGIILFEGGLSLNPQAYQVSSHIIRRLLSLGILITWFAIAVTIWFIFNKEFGFCILAASLVVVTGPTVITPLLKRLKVRKDLHDILHWEGVLIDPIGVFLAILCFEIFVMQRGGNALTDFSLRFAFGSLTGIVGGYIIGRLVRWKIFPEEQLNVFVLACAALIFGVSEYIKTESGVLSVTVAGFVLGMQDIKELRRVREFKAELTDLLIGTLFILLTCRLRIQQFEDFWPLGAILVGVIIFVIRPINVYICTLNSNLGWREKTFLSWVAPRGVVAASMASLFAIQLQTTGLDENAVFLETFTYSVIVVTVLVQGLTAGPLVGLLKLRRLQPQGWLIVGAHALARGIAQFIKHVAKRPVVLVDLKLSDVEAAEADGLTTYYLDAKATTIEEFPEINDVGNLLVLTDNEDLNELVCQRWEPIVGKNNMYRWCRTPKDHNVFGNIVFNVLPKPSWVGKELEEAEANLWCGNDPMTDKDFPLVCFANGKDIVYPATNNIPKKFVCLYLRRSLDYLMKSFSTDAIVFLYEKSRQDVFDMVLSYLAKIEPDVDHAGLRRSLDNPAEWVLSSNGVIIGHGHWSKNKKPLLMLSIVRPPVDFEVPDQKPADIIMCLISPSTETHLHKEALEELKQLFSNIEVVNNIKSCRTPEEVLRFMQHWRWKTIRGDYPSKPGK